MPTRASISASAVAFLFAATPAFAAGTVCPETAAATQSGAAPSADWSVSYSTAPLQLEMVTFYDGPPKDEASLVYDDFRTMKDSAVATWKFAKGTRGYWVKCSYRGTTMELSKALPPSVSTCRVTYNREAGLPTGLPAVKQIDCR